MPSSARWTLAGALTLAAILVPFAIAGPFVETWAPRHLQTQSGALAIAAPIVTLLAVDVLLPVPSSIVSTLAGALLGFPAGFAASLVGMTLGCQLGYGLGRWGAPFVRRLIADDELARVSAHVERRGAWAFALLRPVPVLAEASAFWAGVMRVPPPRFFAVTLVANAAISAIYAAAGAAAGALR
jgi:uncharacterized membrane protein YdjX (TVP38/TMEM64 family)